MCGSFRSSAMTSTNTATTPASPIATPSRTVTAPASSVMAWRKSTVSKPSPVHAREAEEDEAHDSRRRARGRSREHAPLLVVEGLQVLLPVDAVVEPVEDQQEHADRDERDDRLQLLAVARERRQNRLRDYPGHGARDERERDAGEHRPPEVPLAADEARHQGREDEHGFEALTEHDDRRVRGDGDVGLRPASDLLLRACERVVERGSRGRDLLVGSPAAEELHEPVMAAGSVPEVALDLLEERGCQAAETLLGPELEDAVRLEPRRLRLLPVPCRYSCLQPVERRGDDVEVCGLRCLLPELG